VGLRTQNNDSGCVSMTSRLNVVDLPWPTLKIAAKNPKMDLMDIDNDSELEEEAPDAHARCLTGFSSSAAVGGLVLAEETRNLSSLLSEFLSDSDDEERPKWGGSQKGKSANVPRDFAGAYQRLVNQCFKGDESLYTEAQFRRRFRVSSAMFQRAYEGVHGKKPFFPAGKKDATGRRGIHPLVRLTAVFRMLAYGTCADSQDEQFQISETSADNALKSFCRIMIAEFGDEYLNRTPTAIEKARILKKSKEQGFPGCFASWDCKHFVWDKCPVALQGQHKGHAGGKYTKILEAIADDSCFIWFVNFGDPGSLNDINVLDKSSIVGALIKGQLDLKTEPYTINGNERDWMHFLVDGIYPPWAIFVKTTPRAAQRNRNDCRYSKMQEAKRKDIERAFGIVVKKCHALARPIRFWSEDVVKNIVYTCCILHNVSCEERVKELGGNVALNEEDHQRYFETNDPVNDTINPNSIFSKLPVVDNAATTNLEQQMTQRFARCTKLHHLLTSKELHKQLKRDLYAEINRRETSDTDG